MSSQVVPPAGPIRARVMLGAAQISPLLLAVTAAVLVFTLAMRKPLDHDEHQFVASAALMARDGLRPYKDFACFHTPYLIALDAGIFQTTSRLLTAARLVSAGCALVTVWVIVAVAAPRRARAGWVMPWAALVLLLANPFFEATSGRAWNHDLPTMLLVLAFFSARLAIRAAAVGRAGTAWWRAASAGALMGIATGARLTFAPPAFALGFMPLVATLLPSSIRWRLARAYAVGVGVALIPLAVSAAQAPAGFGFGMFTYPTLNTALYLSGSHSYAATPLGKLSFIISETWVSPAMIAMFGLSALALVLVAGGRGGTSARRYVPQLRRQARSEWAMLWVLLLFTLAGSLAPTPLFRMYFFTPAVLLVLIIVYAPRALGPEARGRRVLQAGMIAAAVLALPQGFYAYRIVGDVWRPAAWIPEQLHRTGRALAAKLPPRTVVITLAPILPLEGGLHIPPSLASGPFAVRVSPMVAEASESELVVCEMDDLVEMTLVGEFEGRPTAVVTMPRDRGLNKELVQRVGQPRMEHIRPLGGCDAWYCMLDPRRTRAGQVPAE